MLDAQGMMGTEAAAALQHFERQAAKEGEGLLALGQRIVPALLGAVDFALAHDLPGTQELFSVALEATSAGISTLSALRWDAQTCTSAMQLLKMVPQARTCEASLATPKLLLRCFQIAAIHPRAEAPPPMLLTMFPITAEALQAVPRQGSHPGASCLSVPVPRRLCQPRIWQTPALWYPPCHPSAASSAAQLQPSAKAPARLLARTWPMLPGASLSSRSRSWGWWTTSASLSRSSADAWRA